MSDKDKNERFDRYERRDRYDRDDRREKGGHQIFVTKLPYSVDEEKFRDIFKKFGHISEISLKRGFGFVRYDSYNDSKAAIREMDGHYVNGSRLVVEKAGDRRRRGGPGDYRMPPKGPQPNDKCYNCGGRGHWASDCKGGYRRRRSGSSSSSFRKRRTSEDSIAKKDNYKGHNDKVDYRDYRSRDNYRRDYRDNYRGDHRDNYRDNHRRDYRDNYRGDYREKRNYDRDRDERKFPNSLSNDKKDDKGFVSDKKRSKSFEKVKSNSKKSKSSSNSSSSSRNSSRSSSDSNSSNTNSSKSSVKGEGN